MKRFRKAKPRKMKSVEIELSEWVKFNEKTEQDEIPVQNRKEDSVLLKRRQKTKERRKNDPSVHMAEQLLNESLKNDGAWETKKDYVLKRKERIYESAEEMERLKREYRVLAEYHNDINRLQELPKEAEKKVKDIANVILRLQNDRQSFQEDKGLLDDAKYMQFDQYGQEMPDVIKKLTADEIYLSKQKSEIDRLEGEKGAQQYEKRDVEKSQDKMKKLSIVCMFSLMALFAVLVVLQLQFEADTQVAVLLCGIAFAAVTLMVFIRYFNNVSRAKKAGSSLNQIINRQNAAKLKYVNAKNGVDYVYRKYGVHSASELLFQWEQFIMTKNAKENYQRAGNEMKYYEERLVRLLEQYRMQDPSIWLGQMEYLTDDKQLSQLKKELEGKVEHSKHMIENCRNVMVKLKDEISLLAIKNPDYAEAISELTDLEEIEQLLS